MSKVKNEMLASFMKEDNARAELIMKTAVEQSVEDAVEIINQFGNHFTPEDLEDFLDQLKDASEMPKDGELSDQDLENVAGGVISEAVIGYWVICAGVGALAGWVNAWSKRRRR